MGGLLELISRTPFLLILAVPAALVALAGWSVRHRQDILVRAGVPAAAFALLFGGFPYGSGHGGGGYAHILWLAFSAPLTAAGVFASFFAPAFAACVVAAKLRRGWAGLGIAFVALIAAVGTLGVIDEAEREQRREEQRIQMEGYMRERNAREIAKEHGAAPIATFVERIAPDHYIIDRPLASDVMFRTAALEGGTLTFELRDGAFDEQEEVRLFDPVMQSDLELRADSSTRSGILGVAPGSSVLIVLTHAQSVVEPPLAPDLLATPVEPEPAPATATAPPP